MDRLETRILMARQRIRTNLYSSMDRLETFITTKSDIINARFIFQYG